MKNRLNLIINQLKPGQSRITKEERQNSGLTQRITLPTTFNQCEIPFAILTKAA